MILHSFHIVMHGRCLQQVILALLSLMLSKAQNVIGSDLSCLRSSPADSGQTRVTFLRDDTAGARTLYLTLWSEDMRLVTCEVNTDPLVTESYRALCDRSGAQGQEISHRFNLSVSLAPDAPCALGSVDAPKMAMRASREGTEGKTRRKRAWIFPGTLWCGTGSRAVEYEQLGMFEAADKCCREHDHCLHIIPALTVNYGLFNPNFFTVSHCACDQRFRLCLLGVNDTISRMVGYSFFNILQVPCFELKQQRPCTNMWLGTCKAAKDAPNAVFKTSPPYNTSDLTSKYDDHTDSSKLTSSKVQRVTESPLNNRKSLNGEHRCSSKEPPRGDTFISTTTTGKGRTTHRKLHTVAPSQMPPVSRAHATTPSMKTGLPSQSSTLVSTKKRDGKKKSTGKGPWAYPTQRSQVPPQVTTSSHPQTTSPAQSTPALQLHLPTAIAAVTKTNKSDQNVQNQSRCCSFSMLVRGDALPPHCRDCLEQKTTSRTTPATPSTTGSALLINATTLEVLQLKKTTETPKQDTLKTLWSTATSATPLTTQLKKAASIDCQLRCGSLKHLDECKYKIPPSEEKYGLQNMESKTAFHCDCTSRLAVQIKRFKHPSIIPTLLMDFVSQHCFKLPKKKKCHSRKSCTGGFTKASDLLRALKKIKEKGAAGMQNSGNDRKRGIPVRFYKRCLRLEREGDLKARLTRS